MKRIKIILILFFTFSLTFAGAFIQYFVAESSGDNIILSWQTISEQNVNYYEILRGPNKDNLTPIAKINSSGSNTTYSYIDENAYKTNDSFYAYGLVVVDNDGKKSSPMYTFVTHNNISTVKRTWGSIKALFR